MHATITEDLKESSEPTNNFMDRPAKDLADHEVKSAKIDSVKIASPTDAYYLENDSLQELENTITDVTDFSENVDTEIQLNINENEQVEVNDIAKNVDGSTEHDLNERKLKDMKILGDTICESIEKDLNKIGNLEIEQILKSESIGNEAERQNQIELISDQITFDSISTKPHTKNTEKQKLPDSSIDIEIAFQDIIGASGSHPEIIEIESEEKNKETSSTTDNDLIIEQSTDAFFSRSTRREPYENSSSTEFENVNDEDVNEENIENDVDYEYDINDEADVDDEIQNVERFDIMHEGENTKVNGADHEQFKDDAEDDENLESVVSISSVRFYECSSVIFPLYFLLLNKFNVFCGIFFVENFLYFDEYIFYLYM